MDLTSAATVKNLLQKQGIRPSRGLGQNFLVDKGAIGRIIEAADLQSDDTVLEIGPGLGVLTQELAKRVKKVIAVEKDRNMIEIMKETLKDLSNVEIINGDILKIPNARYQILDTRYKLMGNLPFYLTAPVIRQFLENTGAQPRCMVFVVQKEVGQKICSKPPDMTRSTSSGSSRAGRGMTRSTSSGSSRAGRGMNLLAVSVQFYAEPKIISYIIKDSFWPSPEVDAAIIKIVPRDSAYSSALFRERFFGIVKAGFSQPRKQLINNLSRGLKISKAEAGEWLLKNNIQPSQRAETLTVADWVNLTKNLIPISPKPCRPEP